MQLYFLEASQPLTKTIFLGEDNTPHRSNYPNVLNFTSHEVQATSLTEFYRSLVAHAKQGHCLIKGKLHRALNNEPRAGATVTEDATDWICLDFDGAPFASVQEALDSIALANQQPIFKDVSYIVQYSASHGFKQGLNCHVFIQLSNEYLAPYLKAWLTFLNLNVKSLADGLSLSATGTHISWPLDTTTCQNDKLLYIAPPVFDGVKSPIKESERYQLVPKKHTTLPIDRIAVVNIETIKKAAHDKRNSMREAQGMHKMRVTSTKLEDGAYTVVNPGEAVVTEIWQDGNFVRMNLNGGDSNSYYHPIDNYKYIYCFKHPDERFRTSELLPAYYKRLEDARIKAQSAPTAQGTILLAFRDFKSSSYWNGTWNPNTYDLNLSQVGTVTMVNEFMMSHGRDPLEFVPLGNLIFDPTNPVVVDQATNTVNLYVPTSYLRNDYAKVKPVDMAKKCPLVYGSMMHTISNSNHDDLFEHWLNWLAVIYQHRIKTMAAWMLSGTEGTGKGLIAHRILAPTLGPKYVARRVATTLEENFNGWLERTLVAFLDEVEITASTQKSKIQSKLRNWITDPTIEYRYMQRMGFETESYTNFILATNLKEPIYITDGDRRYNIALFQPEKLQINQAEVDAIEKELPYWMEYIMTREANIDRAATIIKNEARQRLIETSRTSVDNIALAIQSGDFMALFGELPNMDLLVELHGLNTAFASHYDTIMRREAASILLNATERGGKYVCPSKLTREELQTIFEYAVGNMPASPTKITQFLKHRGIHIEPIKVDGQTVRGIHVQWIISKDQFNGLKGCVAPPAPKLVVSNQSVKKAKVS